MIEIRHQVTGKVLHTVQAESFKEADLSGTVLKHASLMHVDLCGVNLSQADLEGANLYRANLLEANLDGVLLAEAFLNGACLKGATLIGANLARADLSHADLSGANLESAYLNRTYFSHTDLTKTQLAKTRGREAVFACCPTLHLARGLEEALGNSRSAQGVAVLDHRTLRACLLHLPDTFLHHCGYTRHEIVGLRTLYADALVPVERDPSDRSSG